MPKKLPIRGCVRCFKSFRPTRSWQRFCGPSCRKLATVEELKTEYTCEYCGLVADTVDHVPPVSIRPVLVGLGLDSMYPFVVVRACRQCNSTLGDRALWTVEQRRDYIKSWLQRRYKKYLNLPDWTDAELNALEYSLRTTTIHRLNVKKITLLRIEFAGGNRLPLLEITEPKIIESESDNTCCFVCRTPSESEFCSDICEYIATGEGIHTRSISRRRRVRWLSKRMLRRISIEKREICRSRRLEVFASRLRRKIVYIEGFTTSFLQVQISDPLWTGRHSVLVTDMDTPVSQIRQELRRSHRN